MSEAVPTFDNRVFALGALGYQILAGNVFGSQVFDETLANDANLDMLMKTGELAVAVRIRGFAGGDGIGELFADPVTTADGTALIATNRNLVKAAAKGPPKMSLFSGPTVTSPGTPLAEQFFIPGGTGGTSTGGASGEALIVLEPQSNYLLRLINKSGVTSPFQVSALFVEGKMSEAVETTARVVAI